MTVARNVESAALISLLVVEGPWYYSGGGDLF